MKITVSYKATVRGYARYAVPGGGIVVFSANLFGKDIAAPTTLELDGPFVAAGAVDAAKLAEQQEKVSKQLAKNQERIAKLQAKLDALANVVPVPETNLTFGVAPWQAEILAGAGAVVLV